MPTARPVPVSAGLDDLTDRYLQVRHFTDALAEPLSAEDQTVQSMPDVSPTKWHRAHTSWFFETFLLGQYQDGYQPFHPDYQFLFNSYYQAVGPRHARTERGLLSRPGVEEVAAYRAAVDDAMCSFLDRGLPDEQASLVELGLHHEQQHQELLLMDIKHVLSVNPLQPAYRDVRSALRRPAPSERVTPEWLAHPGGTVEVGAGGESFVFDNESPRHPLLLQPFALRSTLVTCGEWREFMADDGYHRPELWMSDGWGAACQHGWEAPAYWQPTRDGWVVHTLAGVVPVDDDEPVVHVSWYEADAFARWAGCRLPWESEWEVLAADRLGRAAQWEADRVGLSAGRLEAGLGLHPRPPGPLTDAAAAGTIDLRRTAGPDPAAGDPEQWVGTVWQWTASGYDPYPGFAPSAGAVGEYNGKFMVNQKVLRGSACITPVGHARDTYRNFFYPACRWPYSGVRLAADS